MFNNTALQHTVSYINWYAEVGHISNQYSKGSIQIFKFKATYLLKITARNYYKLRQLYCASWQSNYKLLKDYYKLRQKFIINYDSFITNYDRGLLQIMAALLQIKAKNYYKLLQVLLDITAVFSVITNYGKF